MFDTGYSGSEGQLTWSARGFVLRTGNDRKPFAWPERGVVFDIVNMRTGWCYTSAGGAPQWKWNRRELALAVLRNQSRFGPQPGEKYKKGFSIPCAIGDGKTATWEQSGAASWSGLARLAPLLGTELAAGKLPLVKQFGVLVEKYSKGSTTIPYLMVMQWVDRPACLGGDETFDTAQTACLQSDIDEF